MTIGRTIKERRVALGLSQSELAKRAGTEARQIRRYETDETQPSLTGAGLLARALGLSLDALVGLEPDPIEGDWKLTIEAAPAHRPLVALLTVDQTGPGEFELRGHSEIVTEQLHGTVATVSGGAYAGELSYLGWSPSSLTIKVKPHHGLLAGLALWGGGSTEICCMEATLQPIVAEER